MAVHLNKTIVCKAPVESAFAYTADYRNVGDWLFGIKQFVPVGDLDYGLGAVFDGEMHVGATLTSRIEVNQFEENRLIGFDSIKGFENSSVWTFHETGAGAEIHAEVEYRLPGGVAGKALGRLMAPFVQVAVNKSAEHLARRIEENSRP